MDNAVNPLVEMIGISKSYGGVRACRDLDLTVRAGEVHALLGENGAGKSTLMKVLSGDVTDHDGTIMIDGVPHAVHRAGRRAARRRRDDPPGARPRARSSRWRRTSSSAAS